MTVYSENAVIVHVTFVLSDGANYDFGVEEITKHMRKDIFTFTEQQMMLGLYGVVSKHTTSLVQLGFLVAHCYDEVDTIDVAMHAKVPGKMKAGMIVLIIILVIWGNIAVYCVLKNRGTIARKCCPRDDGPKFKQVPNTSIDMSRQA